MQQLVFFNLNILETKNGIWESDEKQCGIFPQKQLDQIFFRLAARGMGYRTLIEICQVPGVQKLSGTLSLFFFSCSIFFAPSVLSAGRGQAATHHVLQHEKVPN